MPSSSRSRWAYLPSDILTTIATLLGPTFGLLRLRSICHPWRSSLPFPSATVPSPLSLPPFFLRPRLLFLFKPSDGVSILGFEYGDNCSLGVDLTSTCSELGTTPPIITITSNNNNCGVRNTSLTPGVVPTPTIVTSVNNNCGVGTTSLTPGVVPTPTIVTSVNNNCGVGTTLLTPGAVPTPTNVTSVNNNCVVGTTNSNCCGGSDVILGLGDRVVGPTTRTRANSFLVNVEPITPHYNNRFTLLNPLSSKEYLRPNCSLNLLDFGVTFVCVSYSLQGCDFFKKVVVLSDFGSDHDDLVVIGLTAADGRLLLWKQGDKSWTPIICHVRIFNDIASYNGKFYATADDRGRLVVIDVTRERVIDIVPKLMYGSGFCSRLIGCDAGLYLVDGVSVFGERVEVEVFKLDEKGRFWEYEFDLNDCVFFLGDGVNLWLSRKDYHGDVRNVIYFHHGDEGSKIWDMKTRSMCSFVDNEMCRSLFSPPSNCFNEARQ